jgi:uncharacterized protein (DUF2252 family)
MARAMTKPTKIPVIRLTDPSPADLARAKGKALRAKTPRSSHSATMAKAKGRDPVAIILASDVDRLQNLVPTRHTRMLESPFAFYRGTAAIQARDLGTLPSSGIVIQCCGDAHLANFGGFATPERKFIFDINDFDETAQAPFEWDVKRLAASFVLAARWRGFSDDKAKDIAISAVSAYRRNILRASGEATLDAWYAAVTWEGVLDEAKGDEAATKRVTSLIAEAQKQTNEHVFHKLTTLDGGEPRFLDQPPLLYHPNDIDVREIAGPFLKNYVSTLSADRHALLGRLRFVDAAIKVVGVGSVGTRCYVALMLGDQNEPVFLQVKEARESVLTGAAGGKTWANNGERVVVGQRMMQAASDMFLGWAKGPAGRDFYVRQLRDMKSSVDITTMSARMLGRYADLCGQTLARAHAKAGDAALIAGYLGNSDAFDTALGAYALAYADQAEKDYGAFKRAAGAGKVKTASSPGETETMIR